MVCASCTVGGKWGNHGGKAAGRGGGRGRGWAEWVGEKIYIGKEFPDEFANAKDARGLKGANAKAKANAAQAIKELIQIAENKSEFPDYGDRHGNRAKNGWYRYDVRFGLPVYEENGTLIRYNIFSARMLVRHDADGKMYLYDILRTKKEASNPLE